MHKRFDKEICKRCVQEREGEWTAIDDTAFEFGIIRCPVGECPYDLEQKLSQGRKE